MQSDYLQPETTNSSLLLEQVTVCLFGEICPGESLSGQDTSMWTENWSYTTNQAGLGRRIWKVSVNSFK